MQRYNDLEGSNLSMVFLEGSNGSWWTESELWNSSHWGANDSDANTSATGGRGMPGHCPHRNPFPVTGEVRIAAYTVIFLLSFVGNSLVILTLVQNRRMRSVTNIFLLNLSVSDLLLAVFCMPFTLIPTLLQDFIFGYGMCVMIRYLQGVSVGVSVFTLVCISLERYFAICQPLKSRSWQTMSHSYKMIAGVWCTAGCIMVPIAVFHRLIHLKSGAHKCIEMWTDASWEQAYNVFLDLVLLVLPLFLMLVAYGFIAQTLWQSVKMDIQSTQELTELQHAGTEVDDSDEDRQAVTSHANGAVERAPSPMAGRRAEPRRPAPSKRRQVDLRHQVRTSNAERSLAAKKRVIKMLAVVVVEFFVCWTPLFVIQTWSVFHWQSARCYVSPLAMNFIHLLSYVSSCCNPITYCFMNRKFRSAFLSAFRCSRRSERWQSEYSVGQSQRTGTHLCPLNPRTRAPRCPCL